MKVYLLVLLLSVITAFAHLSWHAGRARQPEQGRRRLEA
jgi:hypothetical protein